MILKGILGRSLSGVLCIRGFADLSDLGKISKIDADYQRNLIEHHKKEILKFLKDPEYLFFPEVILSYQAGDDHDIKKIRSGKRLSFPDGVKIRSRRISYKNEKESRVKAVIRIASIEVPDGKLLFNRVDGNHRLSAADEYPDEYSIQELTTPFCLILLPKNTEEHEKSTKFEKIIFHNINFKSIPLTKEEHLKIIFEKNIFSDEEIKEHFGKAYFFAKEFLKKYNDYNKLPNIEKVVKNRKREILVEMERFLLSKIKDEKEIRPEKIWKVFNEVEAIYNNHEELIENENYGLLIALVYFHYQIEKKLLNAFVRWVIDNCVYKIAENDASSIIKIYETLMDKRSKTIFISMAFGKKESIEHYKSIKGTIDTINTEYDLKLRIRAIRMDQFETGYSYKIDDQILKQIDECGLFIADLSFKNVNVYHELGYLMGQNKERQQHDNNFLLLMKKKQPDDKTNNAIGFNISSYKQIRFQSAEDLRSQLKNAIVEYYDLISCH